MSLPVLALLVIGGIATIAVLTWALGMATPRRFADTDEARTAWLREYPALPPCSVTLSTHGTAALVETARGPGLVWAMGADSAARLISGARVTSHARGLRVRLKEYDAPRIDLDLSEDEARAWATHLDTQRADAAPADRTATG